MVEDTAEDAGSPRIRSSVSRTVLSQERSKREAAKALAEGGEESAAGDV
jgi:hypothetical protein